MNKAPRFATMLSTFLGSLNLLHPLSAGGHREAGISIRGGGRAAGRVLLPREADFREALPVLVPRLGIPPRRHALHPHGGFRADIQGRAAVRPGHVLDYPGMGAERRRCQRGRGVLKAIEYLDSVRQVILEQKMDFSEAAEKFSDAPDKLAGGWAII